MDFKFSSFPIKHWAEFRSSEVAVNWKKGTDLLFSDIPQQITWKKLSQMISQAVTLLQQNGATPQGIVAYSGHHRLVGLLCYLATITMGSKILMLNPSMSEIQRGDILSDFANVVLITDQHFAQFPANLTACDSSQYAPNLPATMTLTSGSTGKPKAVVHSIQNHLENAYGVCQLMDFTASDSWLLSLPLFHVSGQGIIWRWLLMGATLSIVEDKRDFWTVLSTVTHASLVTTQLQRYLLQKEFLPQHIQKILLGGSAIPPELITQAQENQIETYVGYGMTEMASTICAVKSEIDNVGLPLWGREVRIVDDEIWVRGAGLALGYWLKENIVSLVNENGWLVTKDRGHWNEQGKLVVDGRTDNVFISGGENIQPEEIERILFQSCLIYQAIVLPTEDTEFGFRPVAVVDFISEFSPQAVRSLQSFASERLEKFKLPIKYIPLDREKWKNLGIKISRKQLQLDINNRYLKNV
ncbi:o-succinylbenzoate--CoA ligase [Otariodibacter oris]|uniref:2-succinylbenzoyl-CoA synthetase n=1 Tax=Otariodibacter oris TaxID=1032623 RepID=A0A420XIZ2_9PAST|nr:o-succinylbenzoate--CoA ligase [Otariodibacter oris]QGM80638.1 o-succinylbenzoate--CoA ligase [Otariodibacter oris]RKR77203.1 2-succinylbenzoyl-CoA synthetase [Otariodibacter oris]